ncbi:cytochrome oxidase assembly protein 1 [Diatrype stigma]|uniref:Cytochrome oxidase assembly protein 1 n=1 Tax=Diatrype stigma TaxID=117547 RepID=A0AAN9UZU1_9PEZI
MLSRIMRRRAVPSIRNASSSAKGPIQRRTLVAAPKPGDGPLMERRPDRELPNIKSFRWLRTFPLFAAAIALSSVAIFNYQKLSSPVVASTLYALRTSRRAREYLGDEVYFRRQVPWISGEMNQLRGRIDIAFAVRGTRNTGVMRFASHRPTPKGAFETTAWSLETSDGRVIDLLSDDSSVAAAAGDPFQHTIPGFADDGDLEERREGADAAGVAAAAAATKGFRQQLK